MFNRSPEAGLDFLIARRLIDDSPISVAAFLLVTDGSVLPLCF